MQPSRSILVDLTAKTRLSGCCQRDLDFMSNTTNFYRGENGGRLGLCVILSVLPRGPFFPYRSLWIEGYETCSGRIVGVCRISWIDEIKSSFSVLEGLIR